MRSWMDAARCRGVDGERFFPVGLPRSPEYQKQLAKAVEFCQACPVRVQCLDFGVVSGVRFGVWGGRDMGANW